MNSIFTRRSVRNFTGAPVSKENITTLLQAAMQAPSAGNEQPWEFVVLQNRETLSKIPGFHPYAGAVEQAPCVIVVCGDKKLQRYPEEYWVQDCSAATQNLLLQAAELGLGAVWLGLYPVQERVSGMQALLHLPAGVVPLCAVAVGHPAQQPAPSNRYQPTRIHWESWD